MERCLSGTMQRRLGSAAASEFRLFRFSNWKKDKKDVWMVTEEVPMNLCEAERMVFGGGYEVFADLWLAIIKRATPFPATSLNCFQETITDLDCIKELVANTNHLPP
jgi:hypothetical protein